MNRISRQLKQWHNQLKWPALAAILCWSISGITHPMMAWFGPQSVKMMPPKLEIESTQLKGIEAVIDRYQLGNAHVAKIVPTAIGPLFQVTESDNQPRRYFSLESRSEISNHDVEQAKWLASYYSGQSIDTISSVQFRNTFDHSYPSVNRLLPVYEVIIGSGDEQVTVFVYTETNALASINNQSKAALQSIFQSLHTWSWLNLGQGEASGIARVLLVGLLMVTLLVIATSGLQLVIALPNRRIPNVDRRWHRRFGYLLWLPLLGWSASGFYHLLQAEYSASPRGVRLGSESNLQQWSANTNNHNAPIDSRFSGVSSFNGISLVTAKSGQSLYRLSVPVAWGHKPTSDREQRNLRFDGQSIEAGSIYLDTRGRTKVALTDRDQAAFMVEELLEKRGLHSKKILDMKLITRFGSGYDFRNKRLPVWQVDLDDEAGTRMFVDPVSNILVDRNRAIDRAESWSFSQLHKWNFLGKVIGRERRDIVIVLTLTALIGISLFGARMALMGIRRKARSKTAMPSKV